MSQNNKVVKHYLMRFYPGTFFAESSIEEVKERDILSVTQKSNETGFRFFDVAETEIDGQVFKSNKYNISGIIYFGTRKSAEEVIAMYKDNPKYESLVANIENNAYQEIVICDNGSIHSLDESDLTMDEIMLANGLDVGSRKVAPDFTKLFTDEDRAKDFEAFRKRRLERKLAEAATKRQAICDELGI